MQSNFVFEETFNSAYFASVVTLLENGIQFSELSAMISNLLLHIIV